MKHPNFATIEEALEDLRQGRMIILVDDENRENEGDLVVAAEKVTPEMINFMIKHGSGIVCLCLTGETLDRLELPLMTKKNKSRQKTQFTVSIEAASGISTGVSAFDRAHTIKVAIDETSTAKDIVSPGHVFPLRAHDGGVFARAGHTEGSTDLARLAGLKAAAAICEVMNEDGTMARIPDLIPFAKKHNLKVASIADLIIYRTHKEQIINEIAHATLPLRDFGEFKVRTYESQIDGQQHLALIRGEPTNTTPLVRLHSECLTGDTFGSSRCDCGLQLKAALTKISKENGILLYLRQEGRGIGLGNKIRAYELQENGLDTVEANEKLGFSPDERDYGIAVQILRSLNIHRIRLMTNNPTKMQALQRYGIEVEDRVPLEIVPNPYNITYLKAKREKLGHLFTFDLEKNYEDHHS